MVSTRNRSSRNKRDYKSSVSLIIWESFSSAEIPNWLPQLSHVPGKRFHDKSLFITVVFPSCRASFSSFLLPIKCFNIVLWMRKLKGKVYYLMLTMIPYRTMARAVVETGAQDFVLRRCHLSRNEIPYSHHQLLKK